MLFSSARSLLQLVFGRGRVGHLGGLGPTVKSQGKTSPGKEALPGLVEGNRILSSGRAIRRSLSSPAG
jgi:hypothetical protein